MDVRFKHTIVWKQKMGKSAMPIVTKKRVGINML